VGARLRKGLFVEGADRGKVFAEKGTAVKGFVVTHVAFTLMLSMCKCSVVKRVVSVGVDV
jgi:hypothetical protein